MKDLHLFFAILFRSLYISCKSVGEMSPEVPCEFSSHAYRLHCFDASLLIRYASPPPISGAGKLKSSLQCYDAKVSSVLAPSSEMELEISLNPDRGRPRLERFLYFK